MTSFEKLKYRALDDAVKRAIKALDDKEEAQRASSELRKTAKTP